MYQSSKTKLTRPATRHTGSPPKYPTPSPMTVAELFASLTLANHPAALHHFADNGILFINLLFRIGRKYFQFARILGRWRSRIRSA